MKPEFIRLLKRVLPYLFLAIVFAAAGIYIITNLDQFRQIKISSYWWLAGLAASCLGQSFFSSLVFKRLLKIFSVKLGFWESLGLVYITGMGNYLIPYVGGIGLRGTYLKKRYGFSLDYFASTVGGAAILSVAINSLIGLMVLLYLMVTTGVFSMIIFLIFLICLIFPSILILLPSRKFKTDNRILHKIIRIWEGWKIISRRPGDVAVLILYILSSSGCGIIILYCSFRGVNENILFTNVAIISAMNMLSSLINITPSGLGVSELAITFTSRALGYVVAIGLSVALIRRFVYTVIIFAGGSVSSYILSRAVFLDKKVIESAD